MAKKSKTGWITDTRGRRVFVGPGVLFHLRDAYEGWDIYGVISHVDKEKIKFDEDRTWIDELGPSERLSIDVDTLKTDPEYKMETYPDPLNPSWTPGWIKLFR